MPYLLPDCYDPPHDLEDPTPFPIYHVEGTGTFAVVEGEIHHTSRGAAHLGGRDATEVLRECWDMGADVLVVEPGGRVWKTWCSGEDW